MDPLEATLPPPHPPPPSNHSHNNSNRKTSSSNRRPPNLPALNLSQQHLEPQSTFYLSETGTFSKDGFRLTRHGIAATPSTTPANTSAAASPANALAAHRANFSSITLDQLQTMRSLGAGACGTVRLARHRPSGELLALKTIHVMAESSQRHQVLNELRVLCSLEHACLVPLLDAFYQDGNIYLALAYMDGGSLEGLVAEHRELAVASRLRLLGLPEPVVAHVMVQVLAALVFLHSRAVVHRDLKPANILLESSGAVRVSDFGISKQLEGTFAAAQSFVGTATYMAPERLRGSDHSTPCDLWSLGIIAVECAQGEHPFAHAASYYDLVVELSESSRRPTLAPEHFSAELRAFCEAALAPAPEARPTALALFGHAFVASSHGRATGSSAAGAELTMEQQMQLAALRLREWRTSTIDAAGVGGARSLHEGIDEMSLG